MSRVSFPDVLDRQRLRLQSKFTGDFDVRRNDFRTGGFDDRQKLFRLADGLFLILGFQTDAFALFPEPDNAK